MSENKGDLISRAALLNEIRKTLDNPLSDRETAGVIMTVARMMPTVDAQLVAHGEWTACEDDWNEETIYTCSVCNEDFLTVDGTPAQYLWNYCPNCGAKMQGGDTHA